uniref:ARAD1D18480p n=1 Tax=Blastobotrys adeninivorans TaxID=409370 RepID=A0A060TEZ7_BLAAD
MKATKNLLSGAKTLVQKSPRDVVIVSALRTPFTKANKGGLAERAPEELLASVLDSTVKRSGLDQSAIEDVLVGTVLQTLGGQKVSASAVKAVGFPISTTVNTINRQCASSAQAISYLAASIQAGWIQAGIAAGVESMTFDYFPHRGIPTRFADSIKNSGVQEAQDVMVPMGITSESVAKKYGITREVQDQFAKASHDKAHAAVVSGHFKHEIAPVGEVVADDGVRANVSLEKLGSLKPVFAEDGVTTAGNSSQITDGASAVVLMSRQRAQELGMTPIGKFIGSVTAGVPAALMGIGPALAVPKLLKAYDLEVKDIDVFEINEAFASQSVYCMQQIAIPEEKLNPSGGAIAIGHPLGATGGRLAAAVLNNLRARNGELGVVSMCTSTGQGYAGLFVKE